MIPSPLCRNAAPNKSCPKVTKLVVTQSTGSDGREGGHGAVSRRPCSRQVRDVTNPSTTVIEKNN